MRIVITGGAGFIGSHVCSALAGRPEVAEIVVVDDLSTGRASNVARAGCRLVVGSVLDSALLDRLIRRVDAVVHLAAVASVPRSLRDPVGCELVNVGGTVRVLEAARRAGDCLVVLASSSAVYGSSAAVVKHEKTPAEPVTPYAVSKFAAEQFADAYARCFDVDVLTLRIFNAFGPRQQVGGLDSPVVPAFLRAALAGQPLPVHGDGRQVRDFTYVGTVANVIADAVCRRVISTAPVNVASGSPRSLRDVVSEIEALLGRSLTIQRLPDRAGDLRNSRAAIGRMRELFPDVEPVGLSAGMCETLADARSAPARRGGRSTVKTATGPARGSRPGLPGHERVVIVSASVGGGHDGAARELGRRLVDRGVPVTRLDFLTLVPWLGAVMNAVYAAMLRWAPWAYQLIYAALNHSRVLAAAANSALWSGRRRLLRALPSDTAMVVSTYPMSSQQLGWLRRRGRLDLPVATFLTDFSVHRLWVTPNVDVHLAVHDVPAEHARTLGAANVMASGSLVADSFRPMTPRQRADTRHELGLPADERLALLVGGSWGVGDIARAAREVADTGRVVPVVVCGQNAALRRRLQARGIRYCLGWVDDMSRLVGAVDVVVQNAGGLTCLEAFAAGVPVLSYRCIPGHGRSNAAALHEAGLAWWVREKSTLPAALDELIDGPRGRRQRAAGLCLGELDPADTVADVITTPREPAADQQVGRSRVPRRVALVAAALAASSWTGTYGTRLAVAHGLNVLDPAHDQGVYLVLDPHAALDQPTTNMLRTLNAAVAVDSWLIEQQPDTVRRLAAAGIVLINAGRGHPYRTGLAGGRSAIWHTADAIGAVDGHPPRLFLTGSDVDAVDVSILLTLREKIVTPDQWSSNGEIGAVRPGDILLIECADGASCQVALTAAQRRAAEQSQPLRSLHDLSG